MRVIVMLRPTNKRGTKSAYTKFRKLLVREGFTLVQSEVFMRALPRKRSAIKLLNNLEANAPSAGAIVAFMITERQFAERQYLCGEPSYQEQVVGAKTQVLL